MRFELRTKQGAVIDRENVTTEGNYPRGLAHERISDRWNACKPGVELWRVDDDGAEVKLGVGQSAPFYQRAGVAGVARGRAA